MPKDIVNDQISKPETNKVGNTTEQRLNGKKEIAKFLKVSNDTVDAYRRKGMPVHTFGRRIWALQSELMNWLEKNSNRKGRKNKL